MNVPIVAEPARLVEVALEQALDGAVIVNERSVVTFFNAAAESLFGLPRTAILGQSLSGLTAAFPGGDPFGACWFAREHDLTVGPKELLVERSDGSRFWASISISPVRWEGRAAFLALVRDVSAEVLRREEQALLFSVAHETSRMVVVCDDRERVIHVNRAFTETFGYSPAEAKGRFPSRLLGGRYTDRTFLARLQRQLASGDGARDDILAYDKAGHEIWITASVTALRDHDGKVAQLVAILEDITQTKKIQVLQRDVLEMLAADQAVRDVMNLLCMRVETIAPDIVASVLHVDLDRLLHPLAAPGLPPDYSRSLEGLPIGPEVGSCGRAAYLGQPVLSRDLERDPLWEPYRTMPLAAGLRACWSTPIRGKDGRVLGTFAFYFREPRGPSPLHKTIVDACVHLCSLAIERHEARLKIHQLAYFDPLTALPNRSQFQAQLATMLDRDDGIHSPVALIFIDLDNFKEVNDRLGHSAGDELLVEVAARLKAAARMGDLVGRLGGDEFVVLLPACGPEAAERAVERLLDALRPPVRLRNDGIEVAASAGISIAGSKETPDTLLRQADMAMYAAKREGGGTWRFFSPDLTDAAERRRVHSTALRSALSAGELELNYQAQIGTEHEDVVGVEALARWHSPVLGTVPPADLIAVAEENGLIDAVTSWSLEEACRQLADWWASGVNIPSVSVNLSPRLFRGDGLARLVAETLSRHRIPPAALVLEITESAVIEDRSHALTILSDLQALGVQLSMDDFGSGHSSLSRLARLPVRELKIDRSFMTDFETDASAQVIVNVIIKAGQNLGMRVVAEGVETEGQRRLIADIGCDAIQGFFYSRPSPPQDFLRWLSEHEDRRSAKNINARQPPDQPAPPLHLAWVR